MKNKKTLTPNRLRCCNGKISIRRLVVSDRTLTEKTNKKKTYKLEHNNNKKYNRRRRHFAHIRETHTTPVHPGLTKDERTGGSSQLTFIISGGRY